MNYLFKSALYYSLEGLLVDLMSHITWTSAYSLNIMNIEYLENCHLKQKVQDINQCSRVWTWLLSVLKKLFILDVDCDDNQENEKKLLMGYTYTTNTFYRFIRTPILNRDRRVWPDGRPTQRKTGDPKLGPRDRIRKTMAANKGKEQGDERYIVTIHVLPGAVSQKHWDDLILCLKKTCIILLLWHLYLISEQRGWRTWWGRENRSCINGIINI